MEKDILVTVQTDKEEYEVGEQVRMYLKILNNGPYPMRLDFASAQRYDFIVYRDKEEVWRWSGDEVFAMVLGSITLKPNEKRVYAETLSAKEMTQGTYKLVGTITSRPPLKATCTFRIEPPTRHHR